jgi:hypothetical protein
MQVTMTFPRLGPQHSRPWFARIAGWPDKGPPMLAFGKLTKGANPPVCVVEAQAGDVVRWGVKDKATGLADPAYSGFGIVRPDGRIDVCDQDAARASRRRLHPEDAQLAPVAIKGGWRKGGGAPSAPIAATVGGSQAVHYAALLAAAHGAVKAWTDFNHDRITAVEAGAHMLALADLLPTPEAQEAQEEEEAPEAPVAPVAQEEEPEEPEPITPPAPLATDDDGYPLF